MKLQNVNSSYYIKQNQSFRAKPNIKAATKPFEEPIKKSGKTLGGIILSGLAALGLISNKKQEESKELTDEEFQKIYEKLHDKTSNHESAYVVEHYLKKSNVDLFKWILKNEKNGGREINRKIYNKSLWLAYTEKLFHTPDIPNEHISKIMNRWDSDCDKPEKSIETYRCNVEKIKKLTPLIQEYEPQKEFEESTKRFVLKFLNQPPYTHNLSYMTKDLLEKFIKENDYTDDYALDVLYSKDEEEFNLRLDILKFLRRLPHQIYWWTLSGNNEEYNHFRPNWSPFKYINKDNAEFIKGLIASGKFSIDMVESIASYTNKDTLETIQTICNDKRIPKVDSNLVWHNLNDGLSKINKENAKRVLELFNMAKDRKHIVSSIKDFALTPKLTMELCKIYNINPLLVVGENYITPESAPVVKKIEDNEKYSDYDQKHQLAKMAAQNREAKDLIEALVDKNCEYHDIKDIFCSVFDIRSGNLVTSEWRKPAKGKLPAILEIARNKDLNSHQTEYILWGCNNNDIPIGFIAKHLQNKTIDINYITYYCRLVNQDNIGLVSKLLWNKDFNQEYLADILRNYEKGSDSDILSIIESGKFNKIPELAQFPTDAWKYILDNNLKLDEIDKKSISYIAHSNNPRLLDLHKQFKYDVYSARNLLKPGLEELTNDDLDSFINDEETISALGKVGKGILESTFPDTIYGVEDFCEDISCMELPEDLYEKLVLKIYPENSQKYKSLANEVNEIKAKIRELAGTDLLNKKEQIEANAGPILNEVKALKKEIANIEDKDKKAQIKQQINNKTKIINQFRQEINSLYKQSENFLEINNLMKEIYTKQSEMKNLLASKIDLSPQKIAEKVRVLAQLSNVDDENNDEKKVEEYKKSKLEPCIDLIQADTEENENNWNNFVNKLIFDFLNISLEDSEKKEISKKLDLIHSKYLSKMFTSNNVFFNNLSVLVKHVKDNINLSIEEIIDNLPQNIKTKEQFKKLGIDYDKWTKVDKNSYTRVKVQLDATEAKRSVIENLEEDLNDEMFNKIPKENSEKIFAKIKNAGFEIKKDKKVIHDENGFNIGQKDFNHIYKDGKPIEFEDIGKIINTIKEQINADEFWFKENEDKEVETAKEHLFYHLMKMRVPEYENAKNIKEGESVDIEVHKTNMYDIKKALGLGNDSACCTALGANFNEWTAPNYIMNKFIGAIELMDRGNFAGNTMIYLAHVDGKLSLILDNIEMKAKYQYNNAIRDAFFDYARKLCAEIGKPNMPIYAGPNRHKVDMTGFEIKEREMIIVGDSGNLPVYLDFDAGSHTIWQNKTYKVNLYKINV